jgi:redox-sensitive bicupin YhaK (pirin superfamily)
MLHLRLADERGRAEFGWLSSRHSFSFGEYYDRKHMGFGPLRVINEDRVQPGQGFGTHGHRDMEILSYVLDGALEHKDSLGNGSVLRPGDIQRMSAGTGVQHSEFNHSSSELVHFLQIWIIPDEHELEPGYAEKTIPQDEIHGRLRLLVSRDGRDGSISIHQDADLYASILKSGEDVQHEFAPGRLGWIQVARGNVSLNGSDLTQGDGAGISQEESISIRTSSDAEVLLFDMTP